jgi:hypothetical protein
MIASFYAGRTMFWAGLRSAHLLLIFETGDFYGPPETVLHLSFPSFISQPRYNFSSPTEFTPHAGLV